MDSIKIFAKKYIEENDQLSNDLKEQLKSFVEETNKENVEYLLITGNPKKSLSEKDRMVVSKYSEHLHSVLNEVDIIGIHAALTAATIIALAAKVSYELSRAILTKAGRTCSKFKGSDRTKCFAKFKKESLLKKMQVYEKSKGKCVKTKDPKECKNKLDKKIQKYKKKYDSIIIP